MARHDLAQEVRRRDPRPYRLGPSPMARAELWNVDIAGRTLGQQRSPKRLADVFAVALGGPATAHDQIFPHA